MYPFNNPSSGLASSEDGFLAVHLSNYFFSDSLLAGPTCSHSAPYRFVKMLSKSFIASILLLASISSVNAHAGVSPALGVKGQITRNDVQRPSANTPCGKANIAQTLDGSTPVQADETGNFSPSITNFNG